MEEDGESGPKLPIRGQRNILITSALPYVNDVPNLRNIIGSVLSADVYARYCRLRGYNAIYIYVGPMIMALKLRLKLSRSKLLRRIAPPKKSVTSTMPFINKFMTGLISALTSLGELPTPQHAQVSQAMYNKLWENKCLKEVTMHQLYCDQCEKLLADQLLVEGSCPFEGCNPCSARGDQSDNCGKLLNPTELKDPRCKVCRTTPRICDRDHPSIELPLRTNKLVDYIMGASGDELSQIDIRPTTEWLTRGHTQGCITRHLNWGISSRHETYKDKVFYAWFDAPIGYASITSCYTSEWEKWWKNPENVELYHFVEKDDLPLHTVMFPSAQLATGENWTLMKRISVTNYLEYDGGNFSKSEGVGVFGNDVKDTDIPVEVWRFYLLINRPEVSNTSFRWFGLKGALDSNLRGNLGKFVYRVLSFIAKPEPAGYGSVIPDAPGAESHGRTKLLGKRIGGLMGEYVNAMERVKLKQGLKTVLLISGEGNKYLKANEFEKLYKEDKPTCAIVIRSAAGLVHLVAQMLEPFMPSFSREVFKQLNLPPHFTFSRKSGRRSQGSRPWEILPHSHRIGTPQPLFKGLKAEQLERYIYKFAGSQRCNGPKMSSLGVKTW